MRRVRGLFEQFISEDKESKVRSWAAANAYSLIFIAFMFIITWGLMIYLRVWS